MKKEGPKDFGPLQSADIVLTTYEVLRAEAPWYERHRCLLRMHWWRVVLDESQRVPKPAGAASAMTAIAKACQDLSRTHSWCMSGTPVGSVVDDLIGQLIFLGIEPYCSRGDNGDAFWEREVSARWKAHDPEALEVVHDLLGQVMMRHSKAQTMAGPGGQRTALVPLPPKTEDVVMLPLQDPAERVVYGELERMCREDFAAMEAAKAALARAQTDGAARAQIEALRGIAAEYRREDLLTPRELQLAATHVATLNLDAMCGLEKKLSACVRTSLPRRSPPPRPRCRPSSARSCPRAARFAAAARPRRCGGEVAGAAQQRGGAALRLVCRQVWYRHHWVGWRRIELLLDASSASRRAASPAAAISLHGVPQGDGPTARPRRHMPRVCHVGGGLSTRLHTPLVARSLDEVDGSKQDEEEAALPSRRRSGDTATPPTQRLAELRVAVRRCPVMMECESQVCRRALRQRSLGPPTVPCPRVRPPTPLPLEPRRARRRSRRPSGWTCVTLDLDGLHFCSMQCAEAKFKRALAPFCSVCQQEGHQNNATFWHEYEYTDSQGRTEEVEKFLHPEPGGLTNVQRNAMGKIVGGPALMDHKIVMRRGRRQRCAAKSSPTCPPQPRRSRTPSRPSLLQPGVAVAGGAALPTAHCRHSRRCYRRWRRRRRRTTPRPPRAPTRAPSLSLFPSSAPAGSFLAHLAAAGAPRSYGKHSLHHSGTKVSAVLQEIERICSGEHKDEKIVALRLEGCARGAARGDRESAAKPRSQ